MDEQAPLQETMVTPPSNYLILAILATILCCLPLGIVSIVYAAQVNTKWQAGDTEGAKQYSRNALIWALVSAGIGVIAAIIAIVAGFAAALIENVF